MKYETSDMYLGAYLLTKGALWLGTNMEDRKAIFTFEDNGKLDALKSGYIMDTKENICAMAFVNNVRKLKASMR
jgi:hypothetical protein